MTTNAPEMTTAAETLPADDRTAEAVSTPETPAEEQARVADWAKMPTPPAAPPSAAPLVAIGVDPSSADWAMGLQPRDAGEAYRMAKCFHASRLYEKKFKNVDAIWTVILLGREHGLSALAALQSLTIIEGKVEMDAALIVAKILRSGAARFFSIVKSDDQGATWRTHRVGAEEKPIEMTFTVADAKRRGLVRQGSNWEKMPDVMCMWRCATKLGRAIYPDVLRGLYGQGEIRETRLEGTDMDDVAAAAIAARAGVGR